MFKIGSYAEAIDDAISGEIIAISNNLITLKTSDGFEMEFTPKQLVPSGNQLDLMKDSRMLYSSKIADTAPKKKQNIPFKTKKNEFVLEVDLHIEKLVSSKKNLSNYDILNIQIETAKRQLEFAILKRFPKVVFIHGVGEGILKADLNFLLGRYGNIKFQEANYQKYGQGATEVTIFQK